MSTNPTRSTHWCVRQRLGPLTVQSWHCDEREAFAAFEETLASVEEDDTLEAAAVILVEETVCAARGPLSKVADPSSFNLPPAMSMHEPETRLAELRRLLAGAAHALRSYQHGNASPSLAADFAQRIEQTLAKVAA